MGLETDVRREAVLREIGRIHDSVKERTTITRQGRDTYIIRTRLSFPNGIRWGEERTYKSLEVLTAREPRGCQTFVVSGRGANAAEVSEYGRHYQKGRRGSNPLRMHVNTIEDLKAHYGVPEFCKVDLVELGYSTDLNALGE